MGLVGGHENYQSVLLRPTKRNAMPTQVAAFWRINTIFELELDLEMLMKMKRTWMLDMDMDVDGHGDRDEGLGVSNSNSSHLWCVAGK